jgi:hypothetical protein
MSAAHTADRPSDPALSSASVRHRGSRSARQHEPECQLPASGGVRAPPGTRTPNPRSKSPMQLISDNVIRYQSVPLLLPSAGPCSDPVPPNAARCRPVPKPSITIDHTKPGLHHDPADGPQRQSRGRVVNRQGRSTHVSLEQQPPSTSEMLMGRRPGHERRLAPHRLIWNQRHLLHALRECERFYNHLNAHRHDRLGGVLHEYEHAA